MTALIRLWEREPALIIGAISAIVALGVGFGSSQDRYGLIMAVVAALTAIATRSRVSPATPTPPVAPAVDVAPAPGTA